MSTNKLRKAFENVNDTENIGMLDYGPHIDIYYDDGEIGEVVRIHINEFNFSDEDEEEVIKDYLVNLEKRVTKRKKSNKN